MQAGFAGLSLAAALALPIGAAPAPGSTGPSDDEASTSSEPIDGPMSDRASSQVAYATYDLKRRDALIAEARGIAAPETASSAQGADLVSMVRQAFAEALDALTEAQRSAAAIPALDDASSSPVYTGLRIGDLALDLQRIFADATRTAFAVQLPNDATGLLQRTLDVLPDSWLAVAGSGIGTSGDAALSSSGDGVEIDGPVSTLVVRVVDAHGAGAGVSPAPPEVVVAIDDHDA